MTQTTASTTVARPHAERLPDALGIGTPLPRLSWSVTTDRHPWRQHAYEIECLDASGLTRSSGLTESAEQIGLPWPFAPLTSREAASVRVRVWGEGEPNPSPWSEPLSIEAGLLSPGDWTARFITPDAPLDTLPLLRRAFSVRPGLSRARLYITALGLYEARLNGQLVSADVLAPGWTSYDHRLRYQTYDVTALLHDGENVLGALLGEGWYRGRLGFGGGRRDIYGSELALLAQLELEYVGGGREQLVTDGSWRAASGPVIRSSIYDGETYDAQLERQGWDAAGFEDAGWGTVRTIERDLATLEAPLGPPIQRTQEVAARAILVTPSGKTVVDFGQNLVGWVRLKVQGQAGQTVTLRHAEVLEDSELGVRPLRTAEQANAYTLRGGEPESWEPRFTFQGFRYVEVGGWPGELKLDDITAVVVHSAMERLGDFSCSDELVNQLHANVLWGMRGNFVDVPTDCPQRDERLGWTGDAQVFAPTAAFLYDVSGFLASWLSDLAAEQDERGVPPFVVPNVLGEFTTSPAAAWTDAAVVIPWVIYERYGDQKVLEDQFGSMCAWVDFLERHCGPRRLWDKGFQFGDWLDPSAPPDQPGAAKTDAALVATAYFARSASLLSRAAEVLGNPAEAQRYAALAAEVRAAFQREYVTPAGRLMSDAATAYALALCFGLLEAGQRSVAGERLDALVREAGYTIPTGFVGTPLICDALTEAGHLDTAYRLLLQTRSPSWLYAVTMGATTIWERWDSMLPDGQINPGEMTSFNHYALGAVADWLHRSVAGLAPAAPGYRQVLIAPQPGHQLTQAQAAHRSPYGPISVAWVRQGAELKVTADLPAGTTAEVRLPGQSGPLHIGSGAHTWTVPWTPPTQTFAPPTLDLRLCDLWPDEALMADLLRVAAEVSPPLGQLYAPGSHLAKVQLAASLSFLPGGQEARGPIEALFEAYRRARTVPLS